MLWDAERHEPLIEEGWSTSAARAGIRELAADAERAYEPQTLWPIHPLDGDPSEGLMTGLYLGASGVVWALDQLRVRGAIEVSRDWRAEAQRLIEVYAATPEMGTAVPSLMLGEVGVRAAAGDASDRMFALIEANIENPTLEMLWGGPGTMLPALFLYERTGEDRWRDLFARNAAHLLHTFEQPEGVWLWTQDLYGERVRLLGAAHGFAGNLAPLLRGAALLTRDQRALVEQRAAQTLQQTAVRTGELVNWSPHVGPAREGRAALLVQWCHGAPGMITALARLSPEPELDALFLGGGETIWRAGPLRKGAGLCHGAAGNGYALLALFERTGDQRWLDRARRFAMHALRQTQAMTRDHGRGRYSLWTGDLGVALFLQDCIDVRAEVPTLDYL